MKNVDKVISIFYLVYLQVNIEILN